MGENSGRWLEAIFKWNFLFYINTLLSIEHDYYGDFFHLNRCVVDNNAMFNLSISSTGSFVVILVHHISHYVAHWLNLHRIVLWEKKKQKPKQNKKSYHFVSHKLNRTRFFGTHHLITIDLSSNTSFVTLVLRSAHETPRWECEFMQLISHGLQFVYTWYLTHVDDFWSKIEERKTAIRPTSAGICTLHTRSNRSSGS